MRTGKVRKADKAPRPFHDRRLRRECEKARKRIHHLLDGKLTPARVLEIKRHLATCKRCCCRYEYIKVLKYVVKARVLSHACPVALAGRIRRAVARLVCGR